MKAKAMFAGFDQAKQEQYEKQLIERFGEKARVIATSELRNAYDKYDPNLAEFLANAIRIFARNELS